MSVFEGKQKMGLIPFELKNIRNVKTNCVPFSDVISGLKQEERYAVYEDNYYRLQEHKSLEKELGMPLERLIPFLKELGIDAATLLKYLTAETCFVVCGNELVEYAIWGVGKKGVLAVPKSCPYGDCLTTFEYEQCGKTWALTKEELS